jgi:UDP-galactopyranose mutase
MYDFFVVGAGYSGSIVAERLANAGARVHVIDRRPHIGGNAYDEVDAHGVLVHRYGPHIFHTNSDRVVHYLSRFTGWRPYEHRVLSQVNGKLLPFPINLTTLNALYGLKLDEAGAKAFYERVREPRHPIRTSEDVVVNAVGRDLYEKFFRGYTRKLWGRDASELTASVTGRIPFRTDSDDRYFTDKFQAIPLHGYTKMFERILDHPMISVELGVDFLAVRHHVRAGHIIFTGPIDAYFGYRFGKLPYRSIRFEHVQLPMIERYQPVSTVNYPNDLAFTRVTEFKYLTGQKHPGTSIVREYPQEDGDPYYPVPAPENQLLYKRYEALAAEERAVTFVGRLALYRYYDMNQVVALALSTVERILAPASGGNVVG